VIGRGRAPAGWIHLGDRLLERGNACLAAQAYARAADAWLAAPLLEQARELAVTEPLEALARLARIERLVGASREARQVAALAYERLGKPEIARAFRTSP
jgi:hypothetical protein